MREKILQLLAVNGSYRENGAIDQAVEVAVQTAAQVRAAVEVSHLRDFPIEYCRGNPMTLRDLIEQVKIVAAGWGEMLEPPAGNSEIKALLESVKSLYMVDLPTEYVNFLKLVNGLELNGLVIYGTKNSASAPAASALDFIEMNEVMKDSALMNLPYTVVIGEDNTGVITYDGTVGQFQYRDRIGLDRIEPYLSFDQMLRSEIEKVT